MKCANQMTINCPILVKSKINYKFSTQMFKKQTEFHTAFVPVVKTQSLKSDHLFCTLKCLMKKVYF